MPSFSNDINNPKKGIGAVERRTRTANNLYPVNEVNIKDKTRINGCRIIDIIICSMPVHKKKHPCIIITRPAEPPDSNIVIYPIIADIKAPDAPQDV